MTKLLKVPVELLPFHDKLLDGLEFCKLAYTYFDELMNNTDDGREYRERKGPIKAFVEEILPLCSYVHAHYGPGQYISIRWAAVTQTYDAQFTAIGKRVEVGMWPPSGTLEITQAQHANQHIALEMLNAEGGCFGLDGLYKFKDREGNNTYWSEPIVVGGDSHIKSMCEIVLNAIKAKVIKLSKGHYPADTTLIVNCVLTTIFSQLEWDKLVENIREAMPRDTFKRIFLVAVGYPYSATI